LWPGSPAFGGIARKKHRPSYFGFRIADFEFFWFSFSFRIPQSTFRNLDARPAQEMMRALWFLRATPLLPGRPKPEIEFIFPLLGEK